MSNAVEQASKGYTN